MVSVLDPFNDVALSLPSVLQVMKVTVKTYILRVLSFLPPAIRNNPEKTTLNISKLCIDTTISSTI
jgi:hypothetical protein